MGRSTSICSALRKHPGQLPEPAAVTLVREQVLLRWCPCDDHRRREVGCSCAGRVHAPEYLLEGLEGSRDRGRTEVHVFGVRLDLRHETQLVDVEMSQSLTQGVCRLPSAVRELSELACGQLAEQFPFTSLSPSLSAGSRDTPYSLSFPLRADGDHSFIVMAKGLHLSPPLEGIPGRSILLAGRHGGHPAGYIAVWPVSKNGSV